MSSKFRHQVHRNEKLKGPSQLTSRVTSPGNEGTEGCGSESRKQRTATGTHPAELATACGLSASSRSHSLGGWLFTSRDGFSTDSLMFPVFPSWLPLFCGLFQRRGWATCLSRGGRRTSARPSPDGSTAPRPPSHPHPTMPPATHFRGTDPYKPLSRRACWHCYGPEPGQGKHGERGSVISWFNLFKNLTKKENQRKQNRTKQENPQRRDTEFVTLRG